MERSVFISSVAVKEVFVKARSFYIRSFIYTIIFSIVQRITGIVHRPSCP